MLFIAVASLLCGCDGEVCGREESGHDIVLRVSIPGHGVISRGLYATDSEFQVNDLTLYFFKSTDFSESKSNCVWKYEMPLTSAFNAVSDGDLTLAFPFPMDIKSRLFTEEVSCVVYAMANTHGRLIADDYKSIFEIENPTVEQLRSTVTKAGFASEVPSEFLMDALAVIPYDGGRLAGEILLERLACRITMNVHIPTTTDNDGSGAIVFGNLKAWFSNGADVASIDGRLENIGLYSQDPTAQAGSTPDIPFYSYPREWDTDAIPYITLQADIKNTSDNTTTETYYIVPVRSPGNRFERNHSYDLTINLDRMGGSDPQEPVELKAEWDCDFEWHRKNLSVVLDDFSYIIFGDNAYKQDSYTYVYELYADTELSIPFNASGDVEIFGIDVAWDDMSNHLSDLVFTHYDAFSDRRTVSFDDYSPDSSDLLGISVDNINSLLRFKRGTYHFNYTPSTGSVTVDRLTTAICPYIFTFDVRLKEHPSVVAKVKIKQYPAIYLERELSGEGRDTRFVNAFSEYGSGGTDKGYLDTAASLTDDLYLGTLYTAGASDNRNIYTVNVTRFLSLTDDYIIGDPRSMTIDNLDVAEVAAPGNWSNLGVDIESGEMRYLENYYPTIEDESCNRFIAPRFSIASQWGMTEELTYDQAKRRCASYQEEGRPAGRWRLPTEAEILYIARLSVDGQIPRLFGASDDSDVNFWTASGAVYVDHNHGVTGVVASIAKKAYVRCVYDDWYWQDGNCDPDVFTWGDMKRDVSRSRLLIENYIK